MISLQVIAERLLAGHGPDNFAEPFKRDEGEDLRAIFPDGPVIPLQYKYKSLVNKCDQ